MSNPQQNITTVETDAQAKVLLKNQEQSLLEFEPIANEIKEKAEQVNIVTADDLA